MLKRIHNDLVIGWMTLVVVIILPLAWLFAISDLATHGIHMYWMNWINLFGCPISEWFAAPYWKERIAKSM